MSEMQETNLSEIMEQVKEAKTITELQEIIEGFGIDWEEIKDKLPIDGELSENELETVSGGGFLGDLWKFISGDVIKDLLKDIIDRRTVEEKKCTYSKDGKTRTCVEKTYIR